MLPFTLWRKVRFCFWRFALGVFGAVGVVRAQSAVTVTIDPTSGRTPISPYIYGTNQDLPGVTATARRLGGNRMTGYNWENNASNAGSDYNQQSDDYMTSAQGIPSSQANVPAITLTHFHDQSIAAGNAYSVLTLPMAGYVAADKNGPVSTTEAAPSPRWAAVKNTKPTAFVTTPDLTDGTVYTDELLNLLIGRYGTATSTNGIRGYDLDNEPDLWSNTHPRLHPAQPTCAELISRTVDLTKAVKRMDATAETFGFVSYGFNGYYSFQNAPDWTTEQKKGPYNWFIDYYLDQMHAASMTAGVRLLDVLDLHNYSEAQGGGSRVTDSTDYTNVACNQARIQAPRSLWDPTYVENSWIGQYYSNFLPFLPKIQASIATFNPGTKLSFTEYNFGGEGHISGGLAEADILGVFGKYGVYLAAIWPLHTDLSYVSAAFKLYLNYDGAGGRFGDTSIGATVSDVTNCSAYGSVDSRAPGTLHIVALNKNYTAPATITFHVAGTTAYTSARVFAFDGTSATLTERTSVPMISGNQFTYTLPPLTAAHFVLTSSVVAAPTIVVQPASVSTNSGANIVLSVLANDTRTLSYQWEKNGASVVGATSSTLAFPNIAASAAGNYDVMVTNSGGAALKSSTVTVTVSSTPYVPFASALVNISTRAEVSASDVMIAGVVIGGSGAKKMLIRAVGPSLTSVGMAATDVLATPTLQLTTPTGAVLASNNGWANDPAIVAAGQSVGAFSLVPGSADAAMIVALPPGNYTAIVGSATGSSGIGLIEFYDLDRSAAARMTNLSTRAHVGTGAQSLVAGFVIAGSTSRNVLVRAVGPTLSALDPTNLGPTVVLPDPQLDLQTLTGTSLAKNNDWGDSNGAAIGATAASVGAFSLPAGSKDAALIATLNPGSYTPVVTDQSGKTGVALVEVYEAP